MTIEPTWNLGLALVLLTGLALAASSVGRLRIERQTITAVLRATAQLAIVSLVVVAAISHLGLAIAFVVLTFAVGVRTTTKRIGAPRCWAPAALAMASGILPVLLITFGSGTAPFTGAALIPIAGIVVGNMMTAHTLVGRSAFLALRERLGEYDAALALGLTRAQAIATVDPDSGRDATAPTNDQTRTVGLVTLPGAFIGVLLGGGSPVQAGAAQLLVLVGILAGQAVTVTVAHRLIQAARLLPDDLRERLHP